MTQKNNTKKHFIRNINNSNNNTINSINNPSHDSFSFPSITPSQLIHALELNPNSILILDIRPQAAFNQSHLKHSINFNLPTTLLKRPLYGVDKILTSLQSSEQRERFERYKTALPLSNIPTDSNLRLNQILVLDHQSLSINSNHPLTLLLNKFSILAFQGRLVWLHGGFQALLNLLVHRSDWSQKFLDQSYPSQPSPDTSSASLRMSFSIPPLPLTASLPTPPARSSPSETQPLPRAPINHSSNTLKSQPTRRIQMSLSMLLPHTPSSEASTLQFSNSNASSTSKLNQPPNSILISSASKPSISSSQIPNPFFDNIRQLNERLSLSGSLQHLSPIDLPVLTNPSRDLPRLPHFLSRLIQDSAQGRAQRLAHEFHDLEMAEQHRLQDVMRWESSRGHSILPTKLDSTLPSITPSSSQTPENDPRQPQQNNDYALTNHHPFSISAGVELGYKNRYKNIWPYEHARIRLRGPARRNDTDYVNASLINFRSNGAPPGLEYSNAGKRKYIATQGPLTSTFEDFWSVVGEEDVGLIIMITRRHEAGREKCADYVRNGQYGEIVISVNHHHDQNHGIESDSEEERDQVTGFFGFTTAQFSENKNQQIDNEQDANKNNSKPSTTPNRKKGGIIYKTIHLSRATRPDLPPRKIAHIQYRGWPDFDVPPAAEEVLDLIKRSHCAAEDMIKSNDEAIEEYFKNCSSRLSTTGSNIKPEDKSEIEKIVGRGTGPVIVHCSAGVGRTGSFILLDVMVDVLKAQYCSTNADQQSSDSSKSNSTNSQSEHTSQMNRHQPSSFNSPRHFVDNPLDSVSTPHLPKFLNSTLCDCLVDVAPIWQKFPIMPVVNEMREKRMSMVANYRQYVFLHEVLMKFMINELKIPIATTTPTKDNGVISTTLDAPSTNSHSIELPPSPESITKETA